ncbi:MAG TPA: HNH endonuclease, partial [Kribbellaceae bacterium]
HGYGPLPADLALDLAAGAAPATDTAGTGRAGRIGPAPDPTRWFQDPDPSKVPGARSHTADPRHPHAPAPAREGPADHTRNRQQQSHRSPADDTRADNTRADDARATDARAEDARAGDARAGDARAEDMRAEEHRTEVWIRRLFTDPVTDTVTNIDTRRRRFDGGLARLIKYRDQGCRDPYCDAPIRHLDHIHPHRDHGPTSAANGAGRCERGNYTKDLPGWTQRVIGPPDAPARTQDDADPATADPDGRGPIREPRVDRDDSAATPAPHRIETTTPTGHRYTSDPPPALGPGGNQTELRRRAALRRLASIARQRDERIPLTKAQAIAIRHLTTPSTTPNRPVPRRSGHTDPPGEQRGRPP